jgi:uncharacterized protein
VADSTGSEPTVRFSILSIDGGGIRGLIPALVVKELEKRLGRDGPPAHLTDYFDLFAGTSTGGLIVLGLNSLNAADPDGKLIDGTALERIYVEDGPAIFRRSFFQRLRSLNGWIRPKHTGEELERVLGRYFGDAHLAQAKEEVVAVAYDMTERGPRFFKRYRALEHQESELRNPKVVAAAMATACGPTYFPSYEVDAKAMVDGGVFAANPTLAAIAEALKRTVDPNDLRPIELLVVSLGTGVPKRGSGFGQGTVKRWGRIGWVLPQHGESPLLEAIFDGQSDAADHWAHMIVNRPDEPPASAAAVGHGPRYFRFQADLQRPFAMDDAREPTLDALRQVAATLIQERSDELDQVTDQLLKLKATPRVP